MEDETLAKAAVEEGIPSTETVESAKKIAVVETLVKALSLDRTLVRDVCATRRLEAVEAETWDPIEALELPVEFDRDLHRVHSQVETALPRDLAEVVPMDVHSVPLLATADRVAAWLERMAAPGQGACLCRPCSQEVCVNLDAVGADRHM